MTQDKFIELLTLNNWNGSKLDSGITVGGSLDLSNTLITSLPDHLTVGGSLYLEGTQITSLPDHLTVVGCLDLSNTQITSLPNHLTVCGSLDLEGTQITSLPDHLTVGGYLDLRGTQITSLPDHLTVGGPLYLEGTQITSQEENKVKKLKQGGRTDKWIFADGMLTHIKTTKKLNGIALYISPYSTVVATKDHKTFAHGKDIRSATQDLHFKTMEKNIEDYRDLTMETKLDFGEAVVMYRVITGSCQYGVQRFIDEHPELKGMKTITIKQIIEVTGGSYGSEVFREFFNH